MSIDPLDIIGFIGFFVSTGVSIYFWERFIFRFVPFIYATVFTISWFDNPSGSTIELLKTIAVMNIAAGGILFFAWLEIRKRA